MRSAYVAGNWKMHKNRTDARELARTLKAELSGVGHKLMVAPPFTAIESVASVLQGSNILVGAQNMAPEKEGAHTGEVSPVMLKDLGVSVVILGHSERRHSYAETDDLINRKVRLALQESLEVILCVGETLEAREAGQVQEVVTRHLEKGLSGISGDQLNNVTIAYEPVWAIGTGKTATPEDANAVHEFIRKKIGTMYTADSAEKLIIQYGGSVKPDNIRGLMEKEHIDGALVGGASLKAETFVPIAQFDR